MRVANGQNQGTAKTPPREPVEARALHQYPDPDSRLTLAQVRRLPLEQWRSVPAVNFGNEGGTGWALSRIYSPSRQPVWLELQSHFIDSVQVWLVSSNGSVQKYPVTGFWRLPQDIHNPTRHRYFLFPLSLEANQRYQVFIRGYVLPGFTLKFAVQYWEPTAFWWHMRYQDWLWSLFVGMMGMALGISVISFVFHPRHIYVYYAGYVVCLTLYALLNDGWGIFLPSLLQPQVNTLSIGYLLSLGLGFLLLFSRQFLNIPGQAPHWWLRISPWWFGLVLIVLVDLAQFASLHQLLGLVHFTYRLGLIVALAVAVLWLSYIWQALREGFRPAWLLLCSQLVMMFFYIINVFLENTGLLPHALPDMLLFRIALVTEIIIITIGWVYRQKTIRESQEALVVENARQQQAIWETEKKRQAEELEKLRLLHELHQQRERLARDLHDGISSQLTHISSRLDLLAYICAEHEEQLRHLSDFTRETIQILRETIWVLDQKVLPVDEFANRLHNFLRKLWEDRESPVLQWQFLSDSDNSELSPLIALHLFRITQEAINNALKYAGATQIDGQLKVQIPNLVLTISDNGCGFDLTKVPPGNGINNMRQRTEEVGGSFFITSSNTGTQIKVIMPLNP